MLQSTLYSWTNIFLSNIFMIIYLFIKWNILLTADSLIIINISLIGFR